ncbi:MAG: hypothetical protein AAFY45_22255, partial [Bacteroidota bacterium]
KGNFQFEDITEQAGVAAKNVWSTGVAFIEVKFVVFEVAAEKEVCKTVIVDIPHANSATIVEVSVGVHIEFGGVLDIIAKVHSCAIGRHEGK